MSSNSSIKCPMSTTLNEPCVEATLGTLQPIHVSNNTFASQIEDIHTILFVLVLIYAADVSCRMARWLLLLVHAVLNFIHDLYDDLSRQLSKRRADQHLSVSDTDTADHTDLPENPSPYAFIAKKRPLSEGEKE